MRSTRRDSSTHAAPYTHRTRTAMQTELDFPSPGDMLVTLDVTRYGRRSRRTWPIARVPKHIRKQGFLPSWDEATMTCIHADRRIVIRGTARARYFAADARKWHIDDRVHDRTGTLPLRAWGRGLGSRETIGGALRDATRLLTETPVCYPFLVRGIQETKRRPNRRLVEGRYHREYTYFWVWEQDEHEAAFRSRLGCRDVHLVPFLPARLTPATLRTHQLEREFPGCKEQTKAFTTSLPEPKAKVLA